MKDHVITMVLGPDNGTSRILLDGEDISHLLAGVTVESNANGGTQVVLRCSPRDRLLLQAQLPEAQLVIAETPAPPPPPASSNPNAHVREFGRGKGNP